MTSDSKMAEGAGEDGADASSDADKSLFGRGALLGLVGGAVVALMLIGVAGSVVSLVEDVFGSSTAAAADAAPVVVDPLVATGESLANSSGCIACHSSNGVDGVGPTWKGLSASVDEEYIRTSILNPNADIVAGFAADVMPATYADSLSAEDLDALVAYITSL